MFGTHSERECSHRKKPVRGNAGLVYTWIGNNFIPGVPLCLSEPSSGKTGNSIRVWDVSTARFTKNTAEETSLFPRDLSHSLSFSFSFSFSVRALCENEGIKACSLLTMPSSHDQVNGSWREIFYPLLYTRFAEISVFQFSFFLPSTLPFSSLCTSAVDKCYCADTLKRALFRNFLFLCFWLSASFSLWLIFWLAGVLKRW